MKDLLCPQWECQGVLQHLSLSIKDEDVSSSCLRNRGPPQVEKVIWENGMNKQTKIQVTQCNFTLGCVSWEETQGISGDKFRQILQDFIKTVERLMLNGHIRGI